MKTDLDIRDEEWYGLELAAQLVARLADELARPPGDLFDNGDPGICVSCPVSSLHYVTHPRNVFVVALSKGTAWLEEPVNFRKGKTLKTSTFVVRSAEYPSRRAR